jgi:hypothetical protein
LFPSQEKLFYYPPTPTRWLDADGGTKNRKNLRLCRVRRF